MKNNSTEAVCTHFHKIPCHVLQVLFLDPVQHSNPLHLLHHPTGVGAAKPHQTQQSQETSPGSSLQCEQGTPTAPTDSQTPVQPDGSTTGQAPEATVPDTPEEKVPKSLNGEGVKNSRKQATTSTTNTQDSRVCFRCKQLGHLKKDCPELLYCSKCRT